MDAWTSGLFFGAMVDEELEADLDEDREADEELEVDLDEECEADEDGSSACAPYLAHHMSCLRSRTPGVKDTLFLGSVRGAKEAVRHLPWEYLVKLSGQRTSKQHRDTESLPRFRPPGG